MSNVMQSLRDFRAFGSSDGLAALAFCLAFLAAWCALPESFERAELRFYDLAMAHRPATPSAGIVILDADDASLRQFGPWPWPPGVYAQLLDRLHDSGASVVASSFALSESGAGPAPHTLDEVASLLDASPLSNEFPADLQRFGAALKSHADPAHPLAAELYAAWEKTSVSAGYEVALARLRSQLAQLRTASAGDQMLAGAIARSGATLLPILFTPGAMRAESIPLPDYIRPLAPASAAELETLPGEARVPPLPLAAAAAGIGALALRADRDGILRSESLVVRVGNQLYPSLALLTAAAALGLRRDELHLNADQRLKLGPRDPRRSHELVMRPHFYRDVAGRPPFPHYSYREVLDGSVGGGALKGQVVLLGSGASGATLNTPLGRGTPAVMVLAHAVSSLIQGEDYIVPARGAWIEGLLVVLSVIFLAQGLVRSRLWVALAAGGAAIAALLLTEFGFLVGAGVWLPLILPALLLSLGLLFLITRRLLARVQRDAAAPQVNAAHAVEKNAPGDALNAPQGVGVDRQLLDRMYQLAQDFERKEQFEKAHEVYRYMSGRDASYRDVPQRLVESRRKAEVQAAGGNTAPSLPGEGIERPQLGRYEIERELGKGAMGAVYLARDPKIGRQVAIKTLALSRDFSTEDMAEVKARFFREAEAAGQLSHPNIVQIFEAGEDQDLAYIAMEFIKGFDLMVHARPLTLLPMAEVLRYLADAAEALDYAHTRGIVHRDIKPANLMIVAETRSLKVTDFGVARFTDAGKSKTGMVIGTPSYMSPEQLAGRKVDGRSDLFSLGVSAYQLLTGTLPFQAPSLGALLYKIANETPARPSRLRPELGPAIDALIGRTMEKNRDARYARCQDFAQALRTMLATPTELA